MVINTVTLAPNEIVDIYFTENMTIRVTHVMVDGMHSTTMHAIMDQDTEIHDISTTPTGEGRTDRANTGRHQPQGALSAARGRRSH